MLSNTSENSRIGLLIEFLRMEDGVTPVHVASIGLRQTVSKSDVEHGYTTATECFRL
jgi:hypothetical protein